MNAVRIALLALVCSAPLAASAQWQWLDKDGHKVFSDQSPPPEVPTNRILRAPAGHAQPAAEAPVATAAPVAMPALARPSGKDPVLEERRKQAAAAETAKKKAEEEKVAAIRADNCQRATTGKAGFDSGQRVVRTNAQGEKEFLTDEQRASEVKRLEEVIARDCRQDRQ
jgi:hypothetical protein